jgi:hypothetical protein
VCVCARALFSFQGGFGQGFLFSCLLVTRRTRRTPFAFLFIINNLKQQYEIYAIIYYAAYIRGIVEVMI